MEFTVAVFIGIVIVFGFVKKVPVFDTFLQGAKGGFEIVYNIAPTIIGIIVAVTMLKSSGAMELLCNLVSPLAQRLGFPAEIVPMAVLRPVSGSGSTALLNQVFSDFGPDSLAGRVASVMAGSTETTFYAVSLYFGSVGIKNIRNTLYAGLFADFTALVFAVLTVRLMY